MAKYIIHPLVVGSKRFDKSMMTYQHGYGTPYIIPIYVWYLEGGDRRILVDTGEMSPVCSQDREKELGGPIRTFEDALSSVGLVPGDIDAVLHTHLHNDHCENDFKCENAEIYVHPLELEHAHNPHPLDFRYLEDYILDVEENGQIKTVDQDCELFPGIKMVHTPAHTPGGMSILVDTWQGPALITGFCVIQDNFEPPREIRAMEMEVIPPGTHVNVYEAYDIMLRTRKMADMILPLHEPSLAAGKPVGGPS
ncbi:MAG: N-acyl homoserine lactonase family protein [Desulfonatronovibrionaceae bacterium]